MQMKKLNIVKNFKCKTSYENWKVSCHWVTEGWFRSFIFDFMHQLNSTKILKKVIFGSLELSEVEVCKETGLPKYNIVKGKENGSNIWLDNLPNLRRTIQHC